MSEEALKAEIARLSGAIDRHKAGAPFKPYFAARNNTYVNPNYKPPSRPSNTSRFLPAKIPSQTAVASTSTAKPPVVTNQPREVVIDGIAFKSSGRTLVRKDLAATIPPGNALFKPASAKYPRTYPGTRSTQRPYKPTSSRRPPRNQNMTLTNGRKPMRVGRKSVKSMKYVNKQCPRFSTTGVCSRARTCLYKHDPSKVAICWPFLQGNCPNIAENCSLSHEPTPERTPLCVHFANHGRCTKGEKCLFPHVRVGPRNGVCRDFAVLGYCDKGIECDKQHVRECPDFAERGACPNSKCKLPHVIRANKRRADVAASTSLSIPRTAGSTASSSALKIGTAYTDPLPAAHLPITGDDAKIGDEYISLTFMESESDDSEDEEDDDDDDAGISVDEDGEGEDDDIDTQGVESDRHDD